MVQSEGPEFKPRYQEKNHIIYLHVVSVLDWTKETDLNNSTRREIFRRMWMTGSILLLLRCAIDNHFLKIQNSQDSKSDWPGLHDVIHSFGCVEAVFSLMGIMSSHNCTSWRFIQKSNQDAMRVSAGY
jgi:hypothetical protein